VSILGIVVLGACSGPKEPSFEVSQATLAQYANTCEGCHGEGTGGAPITGDTEDWAERVSKGMRKVRENALLGYEGPTGIMPAKGGYTELSDEELIAIVDYMVDISR
jgi:cytochrome c